MRKRTAIVLGVVAAALVALGIRAGSQFTTLDAKMAAPSVPISLAGVSAGAGAALTFLRSDATFAITGTLAGSHGGTGVAGSPFAYYTSTAGQSISNATYTGNIVKYGTIGVDTDSAYSVVTGQFTAPSGKGGHYEIVCGISFGAGGGAIKAIGVFVNGSLYVESQNTNTPATGTTIQATAVANVSAAQTLDCRAFQNSGGAQSLDTTATHDFIMIKRLPD